MSEETRNQIEENPLPNKRINPLESLLESVAAAMVAGATVMLVWGELADSRRRDGWTIIVLLAIFIKLSEISLRMRRC